MVHIVYCVEYDVKERTRIAHKKVHVSAISRKDAEKIVIFRHEQYYHDIEDKAPPKMYNIIVKEA